MDLNPEFKFEFGGAQEDADPWEFTEALASMPKHPGQSSLNAKIQAKVNQMAQRKERKEKAKQAATRKRKREETDSEDSDAEALPGELDDDDDEQAGEIAVLEEASDDEDAESDTESDDEEDEEAGDEGGADGIGDDSDDGMEPAALPRLDDEDGDDDDGDSDDESNGQADSGDEDAFEDAPEERGQLRSGRSQAGDRRGMSAPSPSNQADDGGGGDGAFYTAQPASTRFAASGFGELNLSRPLVKACTALGYEQPTPIQAACIPLALMGRDIVGSAITGSGKTAAFALPLLERLLFRQKRVVATYVLVLAPVRELAVQVHSMITKLAQFTDIRAAIVVGGLSMAQQAAELRKGPEIVVATPGRIIDHILNTMSFELDSLSALVLDEADRLLDMGFMEEIKQIVRLAPSKRQTLLFSATMTDEVRKLIALSLQQPVRLAADKKAAAPARLRQEVVRLKGAAAHDKDACLLALVARSLNGKRAIVFCTHKWRAHKLKILLGLAQLPPSAELHGDMTQAARLEALDAFRRGDATILLATDVAARGLDISGVTTVVNYDCPSTVEVYLHRIGRTARAGAEGLAITFAEDGDRKVLKDVVKQVKATLAVRVLPDAVVAAWRAKAERLYPQVEEVIHEERQEKELRKAEMEATKAANMIEHETEIYSRPKREWFLTAKEKKALAEADKSAQDDAGAGAADRSKSRSAKAARNALSKGEKEVSRPPPQHVVQTEKLMGRVRAAKSAARRMREGGSKPKESAKAALTAVTGVSSAKKPKAKKQKVAATPDADPTGARAPSRSHVYEGGGRSASVKKAAVGPSKSEKARFARGGKGKAQFKSKARHKRK